MDQRNITPSFLLVEKMQVQFAMISHVGGAEPDPAQPNGNGKWRCAGDVITERPRDGF